uniref:Uncharacterized protein n=1 Tax=Trichobilharzia regenti TaxID=157069 RepID=A0AA85IYM1_TRIRE|nr:unnamed protein product [Trichobilharzia regenti]
MVKRLFKRRQYLTSSKTSTSSITTTTTTPWTTGFKQLIDQFKVFYNNHNSKKFPNKYLDELVEKILALQSSLGSSRLRGTPSDNKSNNENTPPTSGIISHESANLEVKLTMQKIHSLIDNHFKEYENVNPSDGLAEQEDHTLVNDELVNFKESYEKIKNFIVKLPQFLSFYEKEFNLPASVESIDPVSNVIEEAEQFTRVLENIPKGVKSAKRIMAASQKLHNGLQRILKCSSELPDLSENPIVSVVSELLTSSVFSERLSTIPSSSTSPSSSSRPPLISKNNV